MRYLGLTAAALITGTMLAACSKSQSNTTTTDTTSAATAMRTDSTTSTAPTATTVTPPDSTAAANSASTTPTTMTDANLLGKAMAGDSAEVAIATYMASNTKNASVKSYADLLERDHNRGISQVQAVAKKTSLTPQTPATDTTSQETSHVLDNLKGLSGNDRDTAFVNHEVADHQNDIADTKAAIASAQNTEVKTLLQKEMPELQKHLERGQQLSNALAAKK